MSVDHDLLADYVGGALEGTRDQERVAELIATSAEWGRAADELTAAVHGVQNDLNLLRDAPERMPDDIAARFEGLFDGPRRDPLEPRLASPRSKRTGQAARGRRWKRWAGPLAVAAAALSLFAIGKVPTMVQPMLGDSGTARNSEIAVDAPAAVPQAPVPTVLTGRMYDRGNLQQAAALANGASTYDQNGPDMRSSAATMSKQGAASPWQRLLDPFALQQCLSTVAAVLPGNAELVEYAYFEGSPVLVISITSTDGRWRFVAGANCGQLGPDERYRAPLK